MERRRTSPLLYVVAGHDVLLIDIIQAGGARRATVEVYFR